MRKIIDYFFLFSVSVLFLIPVLGQDKAKADSLLKFYKTIQPEFDTFRLDLLYQLSIYSSKPEDCIAFADELIKSCKPDDNVFLFKAYFQKGQALRTKGSPKEAIECFFKAKYLIKDKNDSIALGSIYLGLADTYSTINDRSNSMHYYVKAIEVFRTNNDSIFLASTLLNLGSEYLIINELQNALPLFTESKNIFTALDHERGVAYCLGNIGNIYAMESNFIQAVKFLNEANDKLLELGDYYSYASFTNSLAEIYLKQNNLDQALIKSKLSLQYSLDYGYLGFARDANLLLSEIYNKLNNHKLAYLYLNQYSLLRDSINNEETIRKMADLRTEYEVSQKQAEIDLLVKENRIQNIIGIGLSAVLLLTAGLVIVLKRNSKRNRILSEKLVEQKAELQLQHDQLEELNQTKDRFFSIISHDLRGPIGVLNGTTLLIREYLESKDYQQLSDLTTNMEYTVKKVQHLLDNLLEWAVSQQGKFNYQPEKVELNEVVHEAMGIFEGMALAKNIMFTYVCKFDNFFIIADRNSLLTILRNLISNAIKFTERNGAITIIAYKSDNEVILKVSDTGVGMPDKKLKTLFKIDERKSTWGTEREKGLGIGLSLVNEFVSMNHGSIEVESKEGAGTTFIVKLPTENTMKNIFHPQNI